MNSHTFSKTMYLVACEVSYAEAYSSDGPEAGDDAENADNNNALLVVPGFLIMSLGR